ncbi:MAG TPA: glycoside hydrolase family 5 protein, partial [Polyangiaceae bacterium]
MPNISNCRPRVNWVIMLVAGCSLDCSGSSTEYTGAGPSNPTSGGTVTSGGSTNRGASTGGLSLGGQGQGGTTRGGSSPMMSDTTTGVTGGTAPISSVTGGTKFTSSATGGAPSSSATVIAGGTKSTGSGLPAGGLTMTGGTATGVGGSKSTGGTSSTSGGSRSTGGATAAGGTLSTSGTASTGDGGTGTGVSSLPAITATQAASSMGKGFNLGQTFESTQNERTLAATSAKIDAYYAKGFRNVRIPITWTESIGGDLLVNSATVGDVNRTHARLSVIKQVVDYALAKPDMYVIINAHHEVALKTNSRSAVLERLWNDIADIFSDRNHRLLFEILNEPHRSDSSAMPAADLRKMTGMAYAKIRAVDAARIVLIGGNQWFASSEVPAVWTDLNGVGGGEDAYVMATFHHYDPWTFCGDNQGTYDDAWTDSNISTPMDTMLSWAKSVGRNMPLHIGEWGVGWGSKYTTMDCNNIRSWYQKFDSQN